jgi:hypothetical protein
VTPDDLIDARTADTFGLATDAAPWDTDASAPTLLDGIDAVHDHLTQPGCFRLVSLASGADFTYRLTAPANAKDGDTRLYLGVLVGGRYDYLGTVWTEPSYYRRRRWPPGFRHGQRSRVDPSAPASKAAAWLYEHLLGDDEGDLPKALTKCEVWRAAA